MKKKLSDIVFKNVNPPDFKREISSSDLAEVLVQRLGLKRKESAARHATLLKRFLEQKRANTPMRIEQIAATLNVSSSQAYEEIRKWRTLNLVSMERVPVPGSGEYLKGYVLTGATINQLLEKVQSSVQGFLRATKRIAKDYDDQFAAEIARSGKPGASDAVKPSKKEEEDAEKDIN
ncbi:MAG: hypothetical protein KKA90_01955 [Nanoarchaeota archaeon]|nr:hypothetical protein [Nanoarchaeota archaeon]